MANIRLPSEREINLHESLDEKSASRHFLGKNLEEAEALFRENALYYQEDLMWMGEKAFIFYVPAYTHYLMSERAVGDADAVNCFAGLLEFRIEFDPKSIGPVAGQLMRTCEYIAQNGWETYGDGVDIYGGLAERYTALIGVLRAVEHESKEAAGEQ